jgi:hypothetical protein
VHSDKFSRDERPAGTSSDFACSPEVSSPFGRDNVESVPPFRVYTGVANPQPLSAPLQCGIRFFLHPLPTAPSKRLTAVLLRSLKEDNGLTPLRTLTNNAT